MLNRLNGFEQQEFYAQPDVGLANSPLSKPFELFQFGSGQVAQPGFFTPGFSSSLLQTQNTDSFNAALNLSQGANGRINVLNQLLVAAKGIFDPQNRSPIAPQVAAPPTPRVSPFAAMSAPDIQTEGVVVIDDGDHGKAVKGIVEENIDPQQVEYIDAELPTASPDLSLDDYLDTGLSGAFNMASDHLESVASRDGKKPSAINISVGFNKLALIDTVLTEMQDNPDFQNRVFHDLSLLPGQATDKQLLHALNQRLESRIQQSPEYLRALGRYQKTTQQLADNGTVIVVASGNEQREARAYKALNIPVAEDAALNFLAMSEHVIVAGAIDDKGTSTTSDDQGAAFSSQGTQQHPITVAADGVNVSGQGKLDGTSFAAPQITSLIAEIKAVNPNVSVKEVKSILQQTATDNPLIPQRIEGAGTINREQAIERAQQG